MIQTTCCEVWFQADKNERIKLNILRQGLRKIRKRCKNAEKRELKWIWREGDLF